MSLAEKSYSVLQRDAILFVTNVINSVLIARALGPHFLGLALILAMIPAYSKVFGRIRVDIAAIYFLGRKKFKFPAVFRALNRITFVSSFIIITFMISIHDPLTARLFEEDAEQVGYLVFVVLIQIPLFFTHMNYMHLHIFREDVKSVNAMVMTRAISSTAFIFVLLFIFDMVGAVVVYASILALLFSMMVGWRRLGRMDPVQSGDMTGIYISLLKYGFKSYLGGLLTFLNNFSAQAIIVVVISVPSYVALNMTFPQGSSNPIP